MNKIFRIWMQPIQARLNIGRKISLYFFMALFPVVSQVIAAILFFSRPDRQEFKYFAFAFSISLLALAAVLFLAWFLLLAQNLGLQYSPANARLVPQLPRTLKMAILIPMIAAAVFSVLFNYLLTQKFSFFPAFICGLMLSFFLVVIRSPWAVIPLILCFQVPALLEGASVRSLDKLFSEHLGLSFELVLLLVTCLIVWATITWTFALRDEALFKLHARSLLLRDGISGKKFNENQISISFAGPFLFWMRHCIERRGTVQVARASSAQLSAFAFGPRLHWSSVTTQVGLISALAVLTLCLVNFLMPVNDKMFVQFLSLTFGGGMLIVQPLLLCAMLFNTVMQTQNEQGLISLAPGSGSNEQRDRAMLTYLSRQFFILYGISVLVIVLLIAFVFDDEMKITGLLLAFSCILPMILGVNYAFARMQSVSDQPLLKMFLICIALFLTGLTLMFYLSTGVALLLSVLICIVTTLFYVTGRRKQLASIVFPAGRAA